MKKKWLVLVLLLVSLCTPALAIAQYYDSWGGGYCGNSGGYGDQYYRQPAGWGLGSLGLGGCSNTDIDIDD